MKVYFSAENDLNSDKLKSCTIESLGEGYHSVPFTHSGPPPVIPNSPISVVNLHSHEYAAARFGNCAHLFVNLGNEIICSTKMINLTHEDCILAVLTEHLSTFHKSLLTFHVNIRNESLHLLRKLELSERSPITISMLGLSESRWVLMHSIDKHVYLQCQSFANAGELYTVYGSTTFCAIDASTANGNLIIGVAGIDCCLYTFHVSLENGKLIQTKRINIRKVVSSIALVPASNGRYAWVGARSGELMFVDTCCNSVLLRELYYSKPIFGLAVCKDPFVLGAAQRDGSLVSVSNGGMVRQCPRKFKGLQATDISDGKSIWYRSIANPTRRAACVKTSDLASLGVCCIKDSFWFASEGGCIFNCRFNPKARSRGAGSAFFWSFKDSESVIQYFNSHEYEREAEGGASDGETAARQALKRARALAETGGLFLYCGAVEDVERLACDDYPVSFGGLANVSIALNVQGCSATDSGVLCYGNNLGLVHLVLFNKSTP